MVLLIVFRILHFEKITLFILFYFILFYFFLEIHFLFIYLFIYDCVESSFLCEGFL